MFPPAEGGKVKSTPDYTITVCCQSEVRFIFTGLVWLRTIWTAVWNTMDISNNATAQNDAGGDGR